uniref:Small ribosomal subunit protein uS3m n=1 Tax=Tuber microsphaerosporum TaxID=1455713 RepID=A0A8F6HA44_9PEZI|nr:ribosomal protein S3 [Tuber microsphaerosporum]
MYKNLGLLYKYINNEKKYSLAGFLAQIYTKKVTLIIIQLRYLQLNPGIIAERLANELTLWKRSPLSSLNRILNKVRIPEQKIHNLDKNSLENLTLLNSISSIKVKDTKVLRELNKEFIRNGIIASINSKITTGVKIQIAGRLTKRATAARAMFKVGHIGVLKNIDSSVIGRSVGLLRGAVRPNLDQTSFVSKSKNGAFSVRVWTSSYYSTLVNPKIIPVAVKKKRS